MAINVKKKGKFKNMCSSVGMMQPNIDAAVVIYIRH